MSAGDKEKAAILQSMNQDHEVGLYDYLAYYAGIKLDIANPGHAVELVDIDLGSLTLNYIKNGVQKTTVIPLRPPMKSFADARVRLTKMAYASADAFRYSPFQIKRYIRPDLGGIASAIAVVVLAIWSHDPLKWGHVHAQRFPALGAFIETKIRRVFCAILLIHTTEYLVFLKPRLDKFRVHGLVRGEWFISSMFEGIFCWKRFAREAARLTDVRKKFELQNS